MTIFIYLFCRCGWNIVLRYRVKHNIITVTRPRANDVLVSRPRAGRVNNSRGGKYNVCDNKCRYVNARVCVFIRLHRSYIFRCFSFIFIFYFYFFFFISPTIVLLLFLYVRGTRHNNVQTTARTARLFVTEAKSAPALRMYIIIVLPYKKSAKAQGG